jgi:hypothetical protein
MNTQDDHIQNKQQTRKRAAGFEIHLQAGRRYVASCGIKESLIHVQWFQVSASVG